MNHATDHISINRFNRRLSNATDAQWSFPLATPKVRSQELFGGNLILSASLDRALITVGKEMMRKQYSPGLWAIALKMAEGNEDAARTIYLDLRVPQLTEKYDEDARVRAARQIQREQLAEERRRQLEASKRQNAAQAEMRRAERARDGHPLLKAFILIACVALAITIFSFLANDEDAQSVVAPHDSRYLSDVFPDVANTATSSSGSQQGDSELATGNPYQSADETRFQQEVSSAATEFVRIYGSRGIGGAERYSESCFSAAASSSEITKVDFCVAFDMLGALTDKADSTSTGSKQSEYFVSRISALDSIYDRFGVDSRSRLEKVWRSISGTANTPI